MKSKFLALFLLAASPVLAGFHIGFGIGSPYYRGYGYYRPPVVYAAPYAYGPSYYGPAYGRGYYAPPVYGPAYSAYGAPPFAGAIWFGPRYYGGRYYRGYWGHRRPKKNVRLNECLNVPGRSLSR